LFHDSVQSRDREADEAENNDWRLRRELLLFASRAFGVPNFL
jgi:hypothetical protein